jgi:hypothetical protein
MGVAREEQATFSESPKTQVNYLIICSEAAIVLTRPPFLADIAAERVNRGNGLSKSDFYASEIVAVAHYTLRWS